MYNFCTFTSILTELQSSANPLPSSSPFYFPVDFLRGNGFCDALRKPRPHCFVHRAGAQDPEVTPQSEHTATAGIQAVEENSFRKDLCPPHVLAMSPERRRPRTRTDSGPAEAHNSKVCLRKLCTHLLCALCKQILQSTGMCEKCPWLYVYGKPLASICYKCFL